MSLERDIALVDDLRAKSSESACVEFKSNLEHAPTIGKYISALSNSAAYAGIPFGYLVWGVKDGDHAVAGTDFDPDRVRENSEPLEFWLSRRLQPDLALSFREISHPDGRLILLEIPAATKAPIEFDRVSYIRISSATPRLSDYPERQRALWAKLQPLIWEDGIAAQFVSADDVLAMLDYSSYFDLTELPLPDNRHGIFERLAQERLIIKDAGEKWNITNLGAILFAKNLADFGPQIKRKAVRFTAYAGKGGHDTVSHRVEVKKGYASGFSALVEFIRDMLPANEHIGAAFRTSHPMFPEIAVRELIANAVIHQDMTVRGAGPSIQLFSDRMEITNPGQPLVSTDRFIDAPPRSRNEAVAALMRRMNICEEEGKGIDKVIAAVEVFQLPPPDFQSILEPSSTRVILQAPKSFAEMSVEDRVRACYQHSVLLKLQGQVMRNASLRERFGIEPSNKAQVSKVIGAALERGLIRPSDPEKPRAGYVPFWA